MGRIAFIRQCRELVPDRFLRATSEAGRTVGPPTAAAGNLGQVRLRGSGKALSSPSLDLALTAGGNITGYSMTGAGTPGTAVRWKQTSESSSQWRGFVDSAFYTYGRTINLATALVDYPGVGPPRRLPNGSVGFARIKRETAANEVQFLHKSTRTGAWTTVALSVVTPDTGSSPDFVVLPSGRLVLAYLLTDYTVRTAYSDDNGATWAAWSTNTRIGTLAAASRQLALEVVDDAILLVASMVPGGTAVDAWVGWSNNGGISFAQTGDLQVWGPARTCVTRTGMVLVATTNRSANGVQIARIPQNGEPSAFLTPAPGPSCANTNAVLGIVCRDDGVVWVYGVGGNWYPGPQLQASVSLDHGITWLAPVTGDSVTSYRGVWFNGINTATPRGWRQFAIGDWNGTLVGIGVSDGSNANRDDSTHELHFGGWDSLTEVLRTGTRRRTYGEGGGDGFVYCSAELPTNEDWTATNVLAGATVSVTDTGFNIVGTALGNTYFTAPTTAFAAAVHTDGARIKIEFFAASGNVNDDRALVEVGLSDGVNVTVVKVRVDNNSIRLVDGAGTTLATATTVGLFASLTEVMLFFDSDNPTATTGRVSAYYRITGQTFWTTIGANLSVAEIVGVTSYVRFGGTAVGAVDWTLQSLAVTEDDNEFSDGFTNPTHLAGRELDAASDGFIYEGLRLGGAGGAGAPGDTWTWTVTAQYAGAWLVRALSPSRRHQSTADGGSHEVVFDAGTTASFSGDAFVLVGTNMKAVTIQMNATDSWGAPSFATTLDATVWTGAIGAVRGPGFFAVDGFPWVPHQFQSTRGRRFFVLAGSTVYEVTDNDPDMLFVDGVDFTAISGTAYIFGDRMAALASARQRYRFLRLLVSSLDTADGAYRLGSLVLGRADVLKVPYALGYVDELPSPAQLWRSDLGYATATARAPIMPARRVAWDPVDEPSTTFLRSMLELYRGLRGEYEPVAFMPDTDAPNDVDIVRIVGPFVTENVVGGRTDTLARIAQIILRSEP